MVNMAFSSRAAGKFKLLGPRPAFILIVGGYARAEITTSLLMRFSALVFCATVTNRFVPGQYHRGRRRS